VQMQLSVWTILIGGPGRLVQYIKTSIQFRIATPKTQDKIFGFLKLEFVPFILCGVSQTVGL